MRHVQQPFPVDTNVTMPEDDIDALFAQLEQITPPPALIARILTQVPQEAVVVNAEAAPMPHIAQIAAHLLREPEMNTWAAFTKQRKLC